jgi:hypothetical protein
LFIGVVRQIQDLLWSSEYAFGHLIIVNMAGLIAGSSKDQKVDRAILIGCEPIQVATEFHRSPSRSFTGTEKRCNRIPHP